MRVVPGRRVAAALALAAGVGCVTRTTHQRVVDERDGLAERVRQLEAQSQSLSAEREGLYGEVEDLRAERDALAGDVASLRAERDRLAERESELGAKAQQLDALQPTYEGLVRDLEADLAAARREVDTVREGLGMTLPSELVFGSGSADLTPAGEEVFERLAARLRDAPYRVLVQGHTDDAAIRGTLAKRFATNWELAGARAARVVRVLAEHGVPPERLAAVSLAQYQPVASNDTPEGRAANRRIEIRLIPLPGAEPDAAPPEFEGRAVGTPAKEP